MWRKGGERKGRDFHTPKLLQFLPATDNSHSGFTMGSWPLKQGMPDPQTQKDFHLTNGP